MQPRIETGRIERIDGSSGVIALDSGTRIEFPIYWDLVLQEGWRVAVTFGSKNQIVRVGLDLSPIGMSELDASNLAKVGARFDELAAQGSLTPEQRQLFGAVIETHRHSMGKDARKLRDRIERALDGDTLPITADDAWAEAARQELATIAQRDAWLALLVLSGDGAKPTKKWLTQAMALVERIGVPAFVETVRRWFALVAPRPVVRDQNNWFAPAMADANSDALKNLVCACSTLDAAAHAHAIETLSVAVGDLAVKCFTKIRGVGALSMKAGNACIYVLSQLPGMRAVAQLSRLGTRVRYKQALALVEKAMVECARRAGVTPLDLEELSLPTFGLDVTGRARIELGEHVAELAIVEDDAKLVFTDGGKPMKSVPAAVKAEHAEELGELKTARKELAALLPTVRARFERWMFEPRSWSLADLRTRYLDHPLVAQLARRVIFQTGTTSVIFVDGFPLDRTGTPVELEDDAVLSLWHPLGRPEAEVAEWRALLANLGIAQPFKQIDRELYTVGDAERTTISTSRFAGHAVRQHQLAALCRERGWSYHLQGQFDGANAPVKQLPAFDLAVELDLDVPGDSPVADSGIYLQVVTGRVRFLRDGRPVALADVPARCFSEVMRDVDLFVAGASLSPRPR
jgi:uncharacterized protein DUF4132